MRKMAQILERNRIDFRVALSRKPQRDHDKRDRDDEQQNDRDGAADDDGRLHSSDERTEDSGLRTQYEGRVGLSPQS